jgi:NADH dehydrogenase (ubiquinone) 1 beta subcomplex subunit 9
LRSLHETKDEMLIHHPTQLIIEETESLLEKWKHPDPYKAPTAPGGSKWERNLPVPSTEGKLYCLSAA